MKRKRERHDRQRANALNGTCASLTHTVGHTCLTTCPQRHVSVPKRESSFPGRKRTPSSPSLRVCVFRSASPFVGLSEETGPPQRVSEVRRSEKRKTWVLVPPKRGSSSPKRGSFLPAYARTRPSYAHHPHFERQLRRHQAMLRHYAGRYQCAHWALRRSLLRWDAGETVFKQEER